MPYVSQSRSQNTHISDRSGPLSSCESAAPISPFAPRGRGRFIYNNSVVAWAQSGLLLRIFVIVAARLHEVTAILAVSGNLEGLMALACWHPWMPPPNCVQWMPLSGRGNGGRVVTLTARPLFFPRYSGSHAVLERRH